MTGLYKFWSNKENRYIIQFLISFIWLNVGYEIYRLEESYWGVFIIISSHIIYFSAIYNLGKLSKSKEIKSKGVKNG